MNTIMVNVWKLLTSWLTRSKSLEDSHRRWAQKLLACKPPRKKPKAKGWKTCRELELLSLQLTESESILTSSCRATSEAADGE